MPDGITAAELQRHGALARQRRDYAEAERSLLRAIDLKHDFADAHFELALTYRDQGLLDDAVDYFQLAAHFAPAFAQARMELGAALAKLGRAQAAAAAYREALALEPGRGEAWISLGNLHKAAEDWSAAIDCYRSAVACDPTVVDAHCRLGYALYTAGRYDDSRASFDAALAIDPGMVEAQHNLGLLLLETGHADEALVRFHRVLAINPEIVETRTCVAHALRDLGRIDEAIRHYDGVLAAQPQFADAVVNRSYALLMKGDYAAGWAAYARRFDVGAMAARGFAYPSWQGEPLAGKRILVYAEQGLGDEIMFASCLPDVLGLAGHCVIECNSRLAALFRRSFARAHVHGAIKTADRNWLDKLPRIDVQVAIGSLPQFLRRTPAEIPARPGYLEADARRAGHWRNQLAARPVLRVGIAWRGGTPRSRQFARSVDLQQWLPVLKCEGAAFYSLQYGDIAAEVESMRVKSGVAVIRLGAAGDDIDELAAIISALDLVISVDNSVAHLAGALGKPVWTLLPCSPEWRYPREGEFMPWYPSMRLFRRVRGDSWGPVIDRAAADLAGRVCDEVKEGT